MKYRPVFVNLEMEDANYTHCPLNDEWNRVERITRIFRPFYDISTQVSRTHYPTTT